MVAYGLRVGCVVGWVVQFPVARLAQAGGLMIQMLMSRYFAPELLKASMHLGCCDVI